MTKEEDFTRILELEEEFVQKMCTEIIALKPDVVFTEKGVSDLAQHYLMKVDHWDNNMNDSVLNIWKLGWYYCYSSSPQVRQQQNCKSLWRNCCQQNRWA